MTDALRAKLDQLPTSPGVYLMKDRVGTIVYIGKAANLRSRVRSYFARSGGDVRAFVPLLEELLGDIETILVSSEKEAILLENELIKRHRPRFNVMLRDDKNFICLRLSSTHPYPRLEVVRAGRVRKDGAQYFGPYASASAIRETLHVVNRHFQLRTCSDHVLENRSRPCLQYQIHRCPAPCVFDIPTEDYKRSVDEVSLFLEGKGDALHDHLETRMNAAATAERFEEAARVRDQLRALTASLEKQRVVTGDALDSDVIGLYREGALLEVQLLFLRGGRLQGGRSLSFKQQEFPTAEILRSFVSQYYEAAFVPKEVLLCEPLAGEDEVAALETWLGERKGERVHVLAPERGDKRRLVEMAVGNARQRFEERQRTRANAEQTLARLAEKLNLTAPPKRIECFDISTFQGQFTVASQVVFMDGEPDQSLYRHYRVKEVSGQDDFASMLEVLTRRFRRGLAAGGLPNLLIVDGGLGQLSVAREALRVTGADVALAALAKSRVVENEKRFASRQGFDVSEAWAEDEGAREKGTVERSPERVFLPGRKNPVVLRQNTSELFLLQRLRDEAHRFAIEFHRKLRSRRTLRSVLEDISGIGPRRRRALLTSFGSLKAVRAASAEEIARVEGFDEALAERVRDSLAKSEPPHEKTDVAEDATADELAALEEN